MLTKEGTYRIFPLCDLCVLCGDYHPLILFFSLIPGEARNHRREPLIPAFKVCPRSFDL